MLFDLSKIQLPIAEMSLFEDNFLIVYLYPRCLLVFRLLKLIYLKRQTRDVIPRRT